MNSVSITHETKTKAVSEFIYLQRILPKHETQAGVSYLVIPLTTPACTISPIAQRLELHNPKISTIVGDDSSILSQGIPAVPHQLPDHGAGIRYFYTTIIHPVSCADYNYRIYPSYQNSGCGSAINAVKLPLHHNQSDHIIKRWQK